MKKALMVFVIVIWSAFVFVCPSHAQCVWGNIEVKDAESLALLQENTCVFGSVIVSGQMMIGDERLDELYLGEMEWISGFLFIEGNPYLTHIYGQKLRHASRIVILNNPRLDPCDAWLLGNQANCGERKSCVDGGRFEEYLNSGECDENGM